MALEQKVIAAATFEWPGERMVAPELVIADSLKSTVTGIGGSALRVHLGGDYPKEIDPDVRPRLDEQFVDLRAPVRMAIAKCGIHTVRHALTVGWSTIMDVENVGESTVRTVREQVAKQCLGMRLLHRPSPAYLATFCRDLSEVPVLAVRAKNFGEKPPSLQDVIDEKEEMRQKFPNINWSIMSVWAKKIAVEFLAAREQIKTANNK